MKERVRSVSTHLRAPLNARWSLCAASPGTIETPEQLADAIELKWLPIDAPDTVAAALRGIGQWSLDGPPRRLDAEDWWFRAVFDAQPAPEIVQRSLAFGGLAGKCSVWLNGIALLTSDNMHVSHECAISGLIEGENELLLRFPSLDAQLAERRSRPRWRAPMVEHAQLRWARVSLLGRTPGWSPPAPTIGPWRAIEWIDRADFDVTALRLICDVEGGNGLVAMNIELAPMSEAGRIETVTLRVSRNGVAHETAAARNADAVNQFGASLVIPNVDLWWPHTHGEPALYDAELVIRLAGAAEPARVGLGCIGFRTLSVDTDEGDFAVRINGVPIFCRGANWTPLDVVSPNTSADATVSALAAVRQAGLNMLRVNGCMVYEEDSFFDACDALGLMVWQDFMFANMDYPATDQHFLASVQEEARQQLARWQAHPSLVVICGNSEVEQQAAMWGSPRTEWNQSLFHNQLAALAGEFCPQTIYWPSSAHGGAFPHQTNAGTTSYYGVGAYLKPIEDARRSGLRFASECLAFANVPAPATIARMPGGTSLRTHHPGWKARAPRDLGAGWDFEDVRDHYLQRLYGVDPVALRSTDHERYLQISRTVSAEIMEATVSEWRRPGSSCRGVLVWFLRDLWAGAGWGLLDERGAPKAAFHGLRRASAPVRIFLTDEGTSGLAVHVVNDPGTPLSASVEIALYREDGLRLESSEREIAVPPHGGQTYAAGEWFDRFIDISRAYRFGPAEYALVAATLRDGTGQTLDTTFFFPEGLPATRRRDVDLQIQGIENCADGKVRVTVSARNFALSVYFDADGYIAEDEYFHMAPGETRAIRLVPAPDNTAEATRCRILALNAWSGASFEIAR
ncbi:MAG: glycoside hydrolase family 2 protein [Sphingomonadaceae bacterium]